ncbi:MAG: group II intron reverse transcriptase/maturase [Planctomycetota bacterium]|nr:MAG: group II intron reverse transcriptase/maturase [Planctomycetota bacterium]REJ86507.1 MAG: group II intron reverse transcriptase/maturase [Planctomycetota bacterium]
MLTALENGVKGGQWFSLIDKVYKEETLVAAARRVTGRKDKAAGVDHVTPEMFERRMSENVRQLHEELHGGTYQPRPVRRTLIPKPGSRDMRPLGIPTIRDRVVQTALRDVIEPIFERDFAAHSYGFRPGRSCKDALRRVDALLKAGYVYVVDADLKSYFDTIPHDRLLQLIAEKISDGRVLALIEAFLKQGVMDGLHEWTPEEGAPQGAVISPLLSNIYLDPLDHLLAAAGFEMVRYADDFVILCRSREDADRALALVQDWTAEAGLTLHPEKTHVAHAVTDGFAFLGYHFVRGERYPRKKSLQKLKATIRAKTRRKQRHGIECTIQDVNRTLVGWFEYFQHVTQRRVFDDLDRFVRQRLRAILKKQTKRPGIPTGRDFQRWPNAYFGKLELFSLRTAHDLACQSSTR